MRTLSVLPTSGGDRTHFCTNKMQTQVKYILISAIVVVSLLLLLACQGDEGPMGPQGIQDEQGIQDPKGKDDTEGDTGPKGEQGIQGKQGIQGDKGEQGDGGATVATWAAISRTIPKTNTIISLDT